METLNKVIEFVGLGTVGEGAFAKDIAVALDTLATYNTLFAVCIVIFALLAIAASIFVCMLYKYRPVYSDKEVHFWTSVSGDNTHVKNVSNIRTNLIVLLLITISIIVVVAGFAVTSYNIALANDNTTPTELDTINKHALKNNDWTKTVTKTTYNKEKLNNSTDKAESSITNKKVSLEPICCKRGVVTNTDWPPVPVANATVTYSYTDYFDETKTIKNTITTGFDGKYAIPDVLQGTTVYITITYEEAGHLYNVSQSVYVDDETEIIQETPKTKPLFSDFVFTAQDNEVPTVYNGSSKEATFEYSETCPFGIGTAVPE